jgi:hypothetical protein
VGLFVRVVIRKAIGQLVGHELSAFTDGSYSTEALQTTDPVSVVRLQVRYNVIRTGLENDTYENVLHFVNTAGELPGAPASDTQKAAVETAFGTFWTSAKAWCPPAVRLSQYRWYHLTFDDPLSGPPTRATQITEVAGNNSVIEVAQCATSITMRTALRKHWGRIYLPGVHNVTGGFQANSEVDQLAAYWSTFLKACQTAQLVPVIYSGTRQMVFSITAIEVDNVPDVVRRRRPHNSTYKKILTA